MRAGIGPSTDDPELAPDGFTQRPSAPVATIEVGALVCVGVLAMLAFHIFENVGMTVGIMPVTGIPLPFMSYGGSSMIATFACVGLVANVGMRRFQ